MSLSFCLSMLYAKVREPCANPVIQDIPYKVFEYRGSCENISVQGFYPQYKALLPFEL